MNTELGLLSAHRHIPRSTADATGIYPVLLSNVTVTDHASSMKVYLRLKGCHVVLERLDLGRVAGLLAGKLHTKRHNSTCNAAGPVMVMMIIWFVSCSVIVVAGWLRRVSVRYLLRYLYLRRYLRAAVPLLALR
jgi:hypothetical protein